MGECRSVFAEGHVGLKAMIPPKSFWPLYDDREVEIYDNPFWDLPGRMRRKKKALHAQYKARGCGAPSVLPSGSK